MAKDSQPLDFDCEDFSSLLNNTITTIPPPALKQNEFNDNTLDLTLPCFDDIPSFDDIPTSTQTSQKRGAAKKKAEITFDPASIDTSNIVQAKRKRKQK